MPAAFISYTYVPSSGLQSAQPPMAIMVFKLGFLSAVNSVYLRVYSFNSIKKMFIFMLLHYCLCSSLS